MDQLGLDVSEVLFVGDRLDEGGNDYPVLQLGIACVAVHGWPQTAEYVASLLATDFGRSPAEPPPADRGSPSVIEDHRQ
jgi:hypothetical protein